MAGKIAFIGGGVMGEAMIKGVLAKGLVGPQQVTVAEVVPARRDALEKAYGVGVTEHPREAVQDAEMVVLAIKPQSLTEVMAEMKGALSSGQLLVSIIAGATLPTLTSGFGHATAVRVMPNTPAQIGQGISAWATTPSVTAQQKSAVKSMLAALGEEIFVAEERYLDMVTAVSGSGPAYVFLFIEAFIDAGVHIGLSREMSERLVLQTVAGSARFALESNQHPAELRNMVTSPGGTTTEALLRLEEGGLRAALTNAVIAAYQKSVLLGRPKE